MTSHSLQLDEILDMCVVSGLEHLLLDAKKKVSEQQDLTQAILQNQATAQRERDPSILPDLCASHRKQLLVRRRAVVISAVYCSIGSTTGFHNHN